MPFTRWVSLATRPRARLLVRLPLSRLLAGTGPRHRCFAADTRSDAPSGASSCGFQDNPVCAVKPIARPVYLDLLRIHLPLPGWVSILHRVSGVLLFAALPLAVWGLSVSLEDEAGFQRIAGWMAHPLARLALLGLIWAFALHVLAGLRHLALDAHWGTDLKHARRSSFAVLVLSGCLAILAAWRLFA